MRKTVAFLAPILTIAVLCIPSDARASIDSVIIVPASPTTEDAVSIQVSGSFPDSCWVVTGEALDRHGTTIDILVRATDSWTHQGDFCPYDTVRYDSVYAMGLLEEGIYTVTVIEDLHSERATPDTLIAQFQVDAPTAADLGDPGSLPNRFELHQNQPNPFNAATTIAFSLDRAGFVSLVIYDLLGRKVRTIVSKDLSSGSHTATWDGKDDYGTDATTGVYFCRLTAGKQVSSRKMVLLK
jgi:hypothetical protein